MNGDSSNTSGSDVPNLSFLPRGLFSRLLTQLKETVRQFQRVVDGEAQPVALDFMLKSGSDCISDDRMAEIVRRIVATVERGTEQGNIVFSVEEPEDHTKAWQQIDPVTKLPVGQYKVWDNEQQKWVSPTADATAQPRVRYGKMYSAPGQSTVNFSFQDLETENYQVTLTPTTFYNGSYGIAPSVLPNGFGALITAKSNAQLTVFFSGIPSLGGNGVTWDVKVEEILD